MILVQNDCIVHKIIFKTSIKEISNNECVKSNVVYNMIIK